MLYKSTRNSNVKVTAAEAISKGISDDGGLFVPDESLGSTVISKLLLCLLPSIVGAVLGVNTRAKY